MGLISLRCPLTILSRGKTAAGVIGVFPSNFVEIVGANSSGNATAGSGSGGAVVINADYRALYDYDAEDETELTIREGDILHVESETVHLFASNLVFAPHHPPGYLSPFRIG